MTNIRDMFLEVEKKEHELQAKRRTNPKGSGLVEVAVACPAEVEEFIEHRDEVLQLDETGERHVQELIDKMRNGELDDPREIKNLDELVALYYRYEHDKPHQSH